MKKRLLALFVSVLLVLSSTLVAVTPVVAAEDVKVFGLFSDTHDAARTNDDGSTSSNSNGGIATVMSDIFARSGATTENLDSLDGVIMVGDIVYMSGDGNGGLHESDDTAYDTWSSNEHVQAVKEADKLVYAMGNHELPLQATDETVVEASRTLFETKTGLAPEHAKTLGGYTFIAAGAEDYTPGTYTGREAWMKAEIEKALADGTNKPIFLIAHHPMADSTYNTAEESFNSGVYSAEFIEYVQSQPRLVIISGHVHTPGANPQTIRQIDGGCTYIQTSLVSGGNEASDPFTDVSGGRSASAMMLEIDSNHVVTVKRFYVNGNGGESFTADWVLDIPAMAAGTESAYKYTDARADESKAPVFADGAVATVFDILETSAIVTVPKAQPGDASENSRVHYYKFTLMNMDNATQVDEKILMADDLYATPSAQGTTMTYSPTGLSGDTNYRVTITPISAFFVEGNPIEADFVTAPKVSYISDITTKALDAAGTEVTDTNLARVNNESNQYGTNYGGSWALGNGYITFEFDIQEAGVYRFTSKVASAGCEGKIVITNKENAEDTQTATITINTGGFGVPNDNQFWTDKALAVGTYTVTVTHSSGTTLRLYSVSAGKIGEIDPADIGYHIKKNVLEKKEGTNLGAPFATASAFSSGVNAFITWEITPEYSGSYSIAADFNASEPGATISMFASNYSSKSEENKMGEVLVNTGYGATNLVEFGRVDLIKGQTYTYTLFSPNTNTVSAYVKYFVATYEGPLDLSQEGAVEISKTWSERKDTNITTSWAGMENSWISFDVDVAFEGNYEVIVTAGVNLGLNMSVSTGREVLSKTLEKTADTNEGNLAWNTKQDFSFGVLPLRAGTQTFTVSTTKLSGQGTSLFHKITLRSVGVYDKALEEVTVDGKVYDAGYIQATDATRISQYNHWAQYDLDLPAGNYKMAIVYGAYSADATAAASVNGASCGTFNLLMNGKYTGGGDPVYLTTVQLKDGVNSIKFTHSQGTYVVRTIILTPITEPETKIYSGKVADSAKLLTKLTDADGSLMARLMLPADVKDKPVTVILALYEGNKLYKLDTMSITGKQNSVAAVTVEGVSFEENKTYTSKVLVIDSFKSLDPYYAVSGTLTN